MYRSPFSFQQSHMPRQQQPMPQGQPYAPEMGKQPEDSRGPHMQGPSANGRSPGSWADRYQNNGMNWTQMMSANPMMQRFMGPGSNYAQMMGSNPYLSQLQNIPFVGSLFGAPPTNIPGMSQQPQIGGELPPTQV